MPTITSSIRIEAPLDRVYAIAKDNRAFPDFMDDVVSLTVTEEDGPRVVSDWVGTISAFGIKVRWTQEDIWDDAHHTCHFKQLKGDYDMLEGHWTFQDRDGGTFFDSQLDYEYVVPGLGPLVKKVVHSLATKNIEGLMQAIKSRAEGA
ncbi:MAG: SRPBCC family protein [Armatimonadetes bacterium]|nr:SRPBCC family protein [Armatimonadota bacterium]